MIRKKAFSNKIMMLVTTSLLFLIFLGVFQNVYAATENNHTDQPWSFNFDVNNSEMQYIVGGKKTDETKIYIYWEFATGTSKILTAPYGSASAYGNPYPAGNKYGGDVQYIMNTTGKYSLTNYVHELGYSYARPGMRSTKGSGTVGGKWSPDSTKNYTVLTN